ncbi:MAG: flagellar hook capping FlgD N-terminal domain-containing protein [Pseudomonadota bacterium]|nr:flagellar hook capping FlgD N-terminal domain-containing protein [Pseudomonadota bacterium]
MADFFPDITTGNKDYLEAMQQSTNPSSSAPSNVMGQADFLMLLTTQLQNQDPSKPMDPTAFVTDLTQMSQLEATTKMNESILAMTASFQGLQTMQAASIIGKNVQVNGEDFSHVQDQNSQFRLNSDSALTDVTVVINDDNGVVKELSIASMQAGEKTVDWNGLDNVDVSRPSGVYSLTAYGTNAEGELQSIDTVVASRVNAVGVNGDGTMTLTLATGERVSMDTVREISG